ncbi:MAG TPA: hypothetical protein VGY57_16335, partial [Vicinamibacterales bacterium]|nr:hypothetical protein [Vicinamibacterales bacterium]
KRFLTVVLALGIVVLIAAIALGERMGDRVLGQATEKRLESVAPVSVTPAPNASTAPYGPNWRRTQVISAASDPGFPDPRVPPVPIPTAPPPPKQTPKPAVASPSPTPTPNLNLPVWRRAAPLPTATPAGETPSPAAADTASPEPSHEP